MRLAVIGGTGVDSEALFGAMQPLKVETPYGSAVLQKQTSPSGAEAFFLARHGAGHALPPHRINYRANIWALHHVGVEGVIATAAVGGLHDKLQPGELVFIDTFIDFTSGRPFTFFDGEGGRVVHTDMTQPYCPTLRQTLIEASSDVGVEVHKTGCYFATNGPRYETPAEVRAYAMLGGDVVGMTGVPEAVLAREIGLCYACVALVTNKGAGIASHTLDHDDVTHVMQLGGRAIGDILGKALSTLRPTQCGKCFSKNDLQV